MKIDICTIPVNKVFETKDGCPICRMRAELEERALDFVMGAAMMEPDVRHETNRFGFCPTHFSMMAARGNRLSLALMLESHLIEIENKVFEAHKPSLLRGPAARAQESAEDARQIARSCYVCDRTALSLDNVLDTFFKMWKKEPEFRASVAEQPCYCLQDYALLLSKGQDALDKKSFPEFYEAVSGVARSGLVQLREDISGFVKMYDYHNSGADFGSLRDAVKNAIAYLTARRQK
jgi:hypothetical protein